MDRRFPATYLGNNRLLIETVDGVRMFVNGKDVHVTPHLIRDGYWEPHVSVALTSMIEPGMVCVDAGAHSGYYTLLMRQRTGESGRVFSFEPNPVQAAFICDSVLLNGYRLNHEISFHPIALGDREGTVSIGFPERHTGGSGVSLHQNSCAQLHDKVELQQITVKRLDDIIDTNVDLMKIDCEGSELEILRGAERILKNHNIRIVLEWAPGFHSPPLSGGEMYDQVVTANNFIARRLTPNQQLEPFNRDDAIQTAHCDILLLRQNKAA